MASDVSAALLTILQSQSRDLCWLAEIYASDELPGASGFDPPDALECFASVSGITYRTRTYRRSISKFGDISQSDGGSFANANLTFDNVDRYVMDFALSSSEIEGMILVIRVISRSVSVTLADSLVLFVGKCDKPGDVSRTDFPLTAKEWLGTVDLELPTRKFSYDDEEGRRSNDPLFEGFRFLPRVGAFSYQVREPRTGLGMWLGLKRTATKTMQFSSHSSVDSNKPVPLCFGRTQMTGLHIGYGDFGNSIAMLTGWADGVTNGIHGYQNIRNISPNFTGLIRNAADTWMHATMNAYLTYGELGGTGGQLTAPLVGSQASNVGLAYYSRTAWSYSYVNGSQVDVDDPAPELVSIIYGLKMPTPNSSGVWGTILLSDNPCDQWRYILTDPHLMNVPASLIDDTVLWETHQYCNQYLVDNANSDTVVLRTEESAKAGVEYKLWQSSGVASPDWFKWLNSEDVNPFGQEAEYVFASHPPIENGPGEGPGDPTNPTPITKYRRRYTSNFPITETQKAVDVLKSILYPSFRGYVTYGANGKIQLRVKKPVDNSLLRTDISIGATEVPVYSILGWRTGLLLKGKLLIGAHLATSEVRPVTGTRYTTAGNSITLAVTGAGLTASGATFTGGDDLNAPAIASITVTAAAGSKTVVIDGWVMPFEPPATESASARAALAGLIAAAVNSHQVFGPYVKANWTPGTAVVNLESKLGFLTLGTPTANAHTGPIASPTVAPTLAAAAGGHLAAGTWKVAYSYETDQGETLVSSSASIVVTANQKINVTAITPPVGVTAVNWYLSRLVEDSTLKYILSNNGAAHSILYPPDQKAPFVPSHNTTAEECMRVMMSFSNRANTQADCTRSNVLEKSFKWPLGSRQKSVNKVILKFRESSDDFRLTELRVRDSRHIAKVGKPLPLEVNGTAIDNFHQAVRIANGLLAENRDADFFVTTGSDGEALLLDVGDVICVTELDSEGVGFVNLPVRIEDKKISESTNARVDFTARKYASSLYDDDVYERNIPLPTSLTPKRIDGILTLTDVGGTKTLSTAEARNPIIEIPATVTLTSNLIIVVPDHASGYIVQNRSLGAYSVSLKTATGSATVATKDAESLMLVDNALAVRKISDSKNQENIIEDINPVAPLYFDDLGGKAWEVGITPAASNPTGQFLRGDAGWSNILQPTAAIVGLTIKGAASQTANLQEWQNSAGGILAAINAAGQANIGGGTFDAAYGLTLRAPSDTDNAGLKILANNQTQSLKIGWGAIHSSAYMDLRALTQYLQFGTATAGNVSLFTNNTVRLTVDGTTGDVELSSKLIFAVDTNLYRSAANTLKTDDSLIVSGSVGIGVTPSSKLDVLTETTPAIRGITNSQYTTDAAAALFITKKARGSLGSETTVLDGDFTSGFAPYAYDGTAFQQGGYEGFVVNGTVTGGSVPQDWVLYTGANAGGLTEKIRVGSGGGLDIVVGDLKRGGTKVVGARGAALTAADGSAVNSGDATTDTVIGNMRTRINELEARLGSATGHGLFT